MAGKQKFIPVKLPIIDEEKELLAENKEKLEGRTVKIDLTRRLKGKGMEISFILDKNGKALPKRIHLFGYFIRRMMNNPVSYVEDSLEIECKNAKLKVKPAVITRKKVSRKVRKGLKKKARQEVEEKIKKMKYEKLFSDLISNQFQKELALILKKIYPLSLFELRDVKVLERKQGKK